MALLPHSELKFKVFHKKRIQWLFSNTEKSQVVLLIQLKNQGEQVY